MPQYTATVAVDDPEVDEFLHQWAERLQVPVSQLLDRVLESAMGGELYIENLPDNTFIAQ